MIRKELLHLALGLVVLLTTGAGVTAGEEVLDVVPGDVLGVVVVRQIDETYVKLTETAKTLQLPGQFANRMEKIANNLPAGVDRKRSVALAAVVNSKAPGAPVPVLFIPTSDYQSLVKQLEPENAKARIAKVEVGKKKCLIARKGDYAVVTTRTARQVLKQVLNSKGHLAAGAAPLRDAMARCDIYAIATPAGIKMAQQGALAGLKAGKARIAEQGGPQVEAALRGLDLYIHIFQALDKELTHFSVGIEFKEDSGLHIVSRTLLTDDGTIAKLAKTVGPPSDNPLGNLPRGPFLFAGGGVYPENWAQPITDISVDMMKTYFGADALTDEQVDRLAELTARSIRGLRSMSLVMGVAKPDEPLYSKMVASIKVDNAKQYLARYEEVAREMGEIGKQAKLPFLSYELKKIRIADSDALKMSMDLGALLAEQQDPNARKAIESMFGPGGSLDVYLAAANADTVVVAYVQEERLAEAIEAVGKPNSQLSRDPRIVEAAAALPSEAQWIGFWSPQGTVQFVAGMIEKLEPQVQFTMPEFPPTAPIAFAKRLAPGTVDVHIVVPADFIKAVPDFAKKMKEIAKRP